MQDDWLFTVTRLGWDPDRFWEMGPCEWWAIREALSEQAGAAQQAAGGAGRSARPTADGLDLDQLKAAFPARKKAARN